MNVKNRQDLLVVVTVCAAALFVGVNFVFTPLQGWWTQRQIQIKKLQDQVKDGKGLIAREQIDRAHWDNMRTNALPGVTSDAEQQFLTAIDGWSRNSGAEITSIMPQWKNDATNYMTLDCRVEAAGELSQLSQFIYNIEHGPMMVRVDSVELSAHDNTGQQLTLGVEINGLALLLPPDKK